MNAISGGWYSLLAHNERGNRPRARFPPHPSGVVLWSDRILGGHKQRGRIHDEHAGDKAAEHRRRKQRLALVRALAGHQPPDLVDDLGDSARAQRQEYRRRQRVVDEAADPDTQHGRQASQRGQRDEVPGRRALARNRRGDADALGDVVQREAHHQKGAQRGLAEGIGRPDRQPLAQVVQADAERDAVGHAQA
jgi:hypothetical protein